jgi:hypothetical protein
MRSTPSLVRLDGSGRKSETREGIKNQEIKRQENEWLWEKQRGNKRAREKLFWRA